MSYSARQLCLRAFALHAFLCAGCVANYPKQVVIEPTYRYLAGPQHLQLASYDRQYFDPVSTPTALPTGVYPVGTFADVPVNP